MGSHRSGIPSSAQAAVGSLALLTLAMSLGACEPARLSLTVRVVSGLRAGRDVMMLDALLLQGASNCARAEGERVERRADVPDQGALSSTGLEVGVFGGLRPGLHAVLVSARSPAGELVASRCVAVSLTNDRVLRVGLTTDCLDVACPGAGGTESFTECLNGRCVEPACDLDDPSAAAACCDRALLGDVCDSIPTLCDSAIRCTGGLACAAARACLDGVCVEPDDDVCSPGQYCSAVTDSCRDLVDGSEADAGPADAAAGPDASVARDTGADVDAALEADAAAALDAPEDIDSAASVLDAGTDGCVCLPGAMSAPAACGRCGTQTQTCGIDCAWGPYGACSGEGPCSAGTVSAPVACGMCGTQTQVCNPDCTWGPYGACSGEGVCSPGAVSSPAACGRCGTRTQVCNPDCTWGAPGACTGEGVCTPTAMSSRSCGTCGRGTQSRTCQSDCTWGSYGACSGDVYCTDYFGGRVCPGATGERGGCTAGCTRTCTCSSTGSWISCAACPTPPC